MGKFSVTYYTNRSCENRSKNCHSDLIVPEGFKLRDSKTLPRIYWHKVLLGGGKNHLSVFPDSSFYFNMFRSKTKNMKQKTPFKHVWLGDFKLLMQKYNFLLK